jgi:hypothetical protein
MPCHVFGQYVMYFYCIPIDSVIHTFINILDKFICGVLYLDNVIKPLNKGKGTQNLHLN